MNAHDLSVGLVQHLVATTVLALLVLAICQLTRLRPATRHLLWLAVLCRLLIPPVVTWPWQVSTLRNFNHDAVADSAPELVARSPEVLIGDDVVTYSIAQESAAGPAKPTSHLESNSNFAATPPAIARWWPDIAPPPLWPTLFLAVWFSGSAAVMLLTVLRVCRVNRAVRSADVLEGWLLREVRELADRLSLSPPKAVAADGVRSPFLWCLGRVRLIWPSSLADAATADAARPILLHELAHLKRRDHWTAWIELLAAIVWWWNPLFWFVRGNVRAESELACDAWVVSLMPESRRAYAESLVELSQRAQEPQFAFGAVGAAGGSRRAFRKRLEMIMMETVPVRSSLLTAAAVMLLAAISLPVFALDPDGQSDDNLSAGQQPSRSQPDKVQKQVQREVITLTEQRNQLTNEQRYAEAEVVARQIHERLINDRNSGTTPEQTQRTAQTDPNQLAAQTTKRRAPSSLSELLDRIERDYYGDLDREELEQIALEAIVSKLDKRSTLLSKEEFDNMTLTIDGDLVGIGIAIKLDDETKRLVVTKPIRRSPAFAAGIRAGDVITSIDGESTEGITLPDALSRIRGQQGSEVALSIQREGETIEAKIVRRRFEIVQVEPYSVAADGTEDYWVDREAQLGYLHIPAFTRQTSRQVSKTLQALKSQGMRGLVIDLRDCGGGLLNAATEVADFFIDEGLILTSRGRQAAHDSAIHATPDNTDTTLPLVLLVNNRTASAAEIVAACLQDHHRAAIVGEQTFGRGTVQSVFPMNNGGALRLTTAAWLRPNGRILVRREGKDDWGVRPDSGLAVQLSDDERQSVIDAREQRLSGTAADLAVDDAQLEQALALLKRS